MFHISEPAFMPCATKPMPGTKNLQTAIMQSPEYPEAMDFGILNCRPVRGGTSLSKHGKGRAGDTGFPLLPGRVAHPRGYQLVAVLRANAWELGLETIIWNRTLYSARWPQGRYYDGVADHKDHVHWEQITPYAKSLTLDQAVDLIGGIVLTPEQEAAIVAALPMLNELLSVDRELKAMVPPSNLSAIVAAAKMVKFHRGVDDLYDKSEI